MKENLGAIPSWPDLYIPPLETKFPALSLKGPKGERSLVSISEDQEFTMYVCGITPYDATHLGHAATYLTFDLINRYQRARGSEVRFVENITDIDEPLLERANRDHRNWQELANSQIDLFRSDMTALHVIPPDDFVPATGVMELIDHAIQQMDKNGFVYRIENDLYFDISSFLKDLPHIECSVIALRYLLGESYLEIKNLPHAINLQGGGSDLIFPHHFMSSAQAQGILGIPFAQHYVHAGMVGLDGEKMSKSKGNLVFVSTLLNSGIDPLVIRFALLSDHYATDRMWTSDKLNAASASVVVIRTALSRELVSSTDQVISEIIDSLADDLNTPSALSALFKWASSVDSHGSEPSQKGAGELSRTIDALLGLAF